MAISLSSILQRFWLDSMTVYTAQQETDSELGYCLPAWSVSLEDAPCKLSFSGGTAAGGRQQAALATAAGDPAAGVLQGVKLFCAPDLEIPPGSRVTVVRQNGVILEYESSGLPLIFSAHQEIRLETEEVWA